ncbi:MAG: dihydrolipoamide acetyltransferase family protein [Hyphomonadaceae bacterium]
MSDTANIVMPLEQEGSKSVVRAWLKKVGDTVRQDEPIVELETDKVAVEVPAPADGVLASIALNEGDEAAPGATLGVLSLGAVIPDATTSRSGTQGQTKERRPPGSEFAATAAPRNDDVREMRLSPLVKRLLSEHRIDANTVTGTGRDGRITHRDVEDFINREISPAVERVYVSFPSKQATPGAIERIPHDSMRKAIADHMLRSVQTAPHVTAIFEADFSAVARHRQRAKPLFDKLGVPLSYSAYVLIAVAQAMKVSPRVNARWHDDHLEVFDDVNIGVGVALGEKGLIVPVVKRAQGLPLLHMARRLNDLTERARRNALKPADVQGGTFTISNHGVSGSLVATPIIINQPQSAILGVGKLEKRVVVRQVDGADAMVIKPMAYVSLTIDHRVLDGHQTNAWLTRFVEVLETWPQEDEA